MLCLSILWEGTVSKEEAGEMEKHYIETYRKKGYDICNVLDGGFNPPPRRGVKGSPELKQKLIDSSTRKKAVAQYMKDGKFVKEFIGVREACRQTGIDHRSISQVAAGSKIRKTAGGYLWKYI